MAGRVRSRVHARTSYSRILARAGVRASRITTALLTLSTFHTFHADNFGVSQYTVLGNVIKRIQPQVRELSVPSIRILVEAFLKCAVHSYSRRSVPSSLLQLVAWLLYDSPLLH